MELLRDLLGELPREQMETLALRTLLGCSLEETALSTGVPVNTVRSRVRLAKERLRHRIEADPGLMESLGVT
jgi:RNA polymerase sigma-70 factor (ECF subfamily)